MPEPSKRGWKKEEENEEKNIIVKKTKVLRSRTYISIYLLKNSRLIHLSWHSWCFLLFSYVHTFTLTFYFCFRFPSSVLRGSYVGKTKAMSLICNCQVLFNARMLKRTVTAFIYMCVLNIYNASMNERAFSVTKIKVSKHLYAVVVTLTDNKWKPIMAKVLCIYTPACLPAEFINIDVYKSLWMNKNRWIYIISNE